MTRPIDIEVDNISKILNQRLEVLDFKLLTFFVLFCLFVFDLFEVFVVDLDIFFKLLYKKEGGYQFPPFT